MHTPLGFGVLGKADSFIPPLAESHFPTCAIYDDGSVKCWDEEETDKYVHAHVIQSLYVLPLVHSLQRCLRLRHTHLHSLTLAITLMHMLQLQ